MSAGGSGATGSNAAAVGSPPRYAELQVTSHFSFLRGASFCEELFAQAAHLGLEALAITDRNSLAGIIRAYEAARTTEVRLIVGCRLDLTDGTSFLVYPTDRPAYAQLCRMLSVGKKRGGKAQCHLTWSDVVAYGEGLLAVYLPDEADESCALNLRRLRQGLRRSRLYGTHIKTPAEGSAAAARSCKSSLHSWCAKRGDERCFVPCA